MRPETCEEMERHLRACSHCTSACDSLRKTLALCKTIPTPIVPKHVQDSIREALSRAIADAS
jgi:RNA polymerase sigma-70 factor (ECF subfamily)